MEPTIDKDQELFDSILISNCETDKCAYLRYTDAENGRCYCSISETSQCPVVIASHAKPGEAVPEPAIPPQEYEVWCRDVAEVSQVIVANSLRHANDLAGEMVSNGQLAPLFDSTTEFGAREIELGVINYTLVVDSLGTISTIYCSGDINSILLELESNAFEVLAIFKGEHEDMLV